MNNIEGKKVLSLKECVSFVCEEYSLFGDVVERKTSDPTAEPEHYIVVGMNKLPDEDPKLIEKRAARSFLLFYPHSFALKVGSDITPSDLIYKLVEHCREAEFTKGIFNEFRCDVPEVLRRDELYTLKRFDDQRHNNKLNGIGKQRFHKSLQRFFKNEKSKSKFKQAWKKHYRSERFDKNAPLIKQYLNFFRRNNPEVSLETLHSSCDNLKLTVMNDNEYNYFKKQMKKLHPEISYAVSDKEIVDHGMIKVPDGIENPFGECVTYDEYFKRLQDDFAESGFESIQDLNVSHWEFRNVTFRASDESVVASVLNPYRFGFIKDNQLDTILSLGPCDVISIPNKEVLNFYSLARSHNLPFYIDNRNQFADSSLDSVQVVYSQASQGVIDKIQYQLMGDKIVGSHMITEKQRKKHLSNQICAAETKEDKKKIIDYNHQSCNYNIAQEK